MGILLKAWDEFIKVFGYNERRRDIIEGLKLAISELEECGCSKIYINGSFVTKKRNPGDFDACWRDIGENIDKKKMMGKFATLFAGTKEMQHFRYKGDMRPAFDFANLDKCYLEFFQIDKYDKSVKGIIELEIKNICYDKE
jgi:hypothetical protein